MDTAPSVTIGLADAAKQLGISESLARQLERRGELPGAFRLGGRILVHREVFNAELARLAKGQPLTETDTDQLLKRAMADAHAQLVSFGRTRRTARNSEHSFV